MPLPLQKPEDEVFLHSLTKDTPKKRLGMKTAAERLYKKNNIKMHEENISEE